MSFARGSVIAAVVVAGCTASTQVSSSMSVDTAAPARVAKSGKKAAPKPVWRSSVEFRPGGTFQAMDAKDGVLAESVVTRMEQDGFFPGCAPAAKAVPASASDGK